MIKILVEKKDDKESEKEVKDEKTPKNTDKTSDKKEPDVKTNKQKNFPKKENPFDKNKNGELSDEQQKNLEMKDFDLTEPDKMSDDIKNIFKKVKLYIDNEDNKPKNMKPEGYAFSIIYKKGVALDYSGGWIIWKNDNIGEEEYVYTLSDGYFWKSKAKNNVHKDSEGKDKTGEDNKVDKKDNKNPFQKEKTVEEQIEYVLVYNKVKNMLPENHKFSLYKEKNNWIIETKNFHNLKTFLSLAFETKVLKTKDNEIKIMIK